MTKKELNEIKKELKIQFKLIRSRKALYYSDKFDSFYIRPHLSVKAKNSPQWQKELIFIDWADDLGIEL